MNPDSISEWDDMSRITVQNSIYSKHDQTHSFSPCYRPAPAAVHTLIDDSIDSQDLNRPEEIQTFGHSLPQQ